MLDTQLTHHLQQQREATVRRHVAAENRHDVHGVIATFHHPCYDVVPLGILSDGAAAVDEFLSGVLSGFPNFAAHVRSLHQAENAVIVEGNFTGTQTGAWAGLPPSGREVNVRFCAVFDFEHERMLCERLYFDLATMMRQLGVS